MLISKRLLRVTYGLIFIFAGALTLYASLNYYYNQISNNLYARLFSSFLFYLATVFIILGCFALLFVLISKAREMYALYQKNHKITSTSLLWSTLVIGGTLLAYYVVYQQAVASTTTIACFSVVPSSRPTPQSLTSDTLNFSAKVNSLGYVEGYYQVVLELTFIPAAGVAPQPKFPQTWSYEVLFTNALGTSNEINQTSYSVPRNYPNGGPGNPYNNYTIEGVTFVQHYDTIAYSFDRVDAKNFPSLPLLYDSANQIANLILELNVAPPC